MKTLAPEITAHPTLSSLGGLRPDPVSKSAHLENQMEKQGSDAFKSPFLCLSSLLVGTLRRSETHSVLLIAHVT